MSEAPKSPAQVINDLSDQVRLLRQDVTNLTATATTKKEAAALRAAVQASVKEAQDAQAALAEYERQLLIERTNEGLAHARAQGRHGGRRRVLTDQQVTAIEAAAGTISNADLAAMHGVSLRTISRVRSGTYTPE